MARGTPAVEPELCEALKKLKLGRMLDTLPERLTLAQKNALSHQELLLLVVQDEIDRRESTATVRRANNAGLEPDMTLERWDATAKVRFDRRVLDELACLRFVEARRNVVILGPVGVGKTFLGTALGHVACRHRFQVHFTRADEKRGICPPCKARRMANTAAHLVDHVIAPDVTLRQWVLTVPFELRLLLAAKPEALSAVGRLFLRELLRWQRQQAATLGFEQAEGAAVSFCQRFGSSLNLNIHWHVVAPNAVFVADAGGERVHTVKLPPPVLLDLAEMVTAVSIRLVRWLERRSYLREQSDDHPAEGSACDAPWLRCLQGSLGVGELRRRAEHGCAKERAGGGERGSRTRRSQGLAAQNLRFNLHAGVSAAGTMTAARERLLRYCARPPLALERLSRREDGRLCYRIKGSDRARILTPMQLMARLAALVPSPRHPMPRPHRVGFGCGHRVLGGLGPWPADRANSRAMWRWSRAFPPGWCPLRFRARPPPLSHRASPPAGACGLRASLLPQASGAGPGSRALRGGGPAGRPPWCDLPHRPLTGRAWALRGSWGAQAPTRWRRRAGRTRAGRRLRRR